LYKIFGKRYLDYKKYVSDDVDATIKFKENTLFVDFLRYHAPTFHIGILGFWMGLIGDGKSTTLRLLQETRSIKQNGHVN